MADRLLLEYPTKILLEDGTSALLLEDGTFLLNEASAILATDAYQLEDASGVILLESLAITAAIVEAQAAQTEAILASERYSAAIAESQAAQTEAIVAAEKYSAAVGETQAGQSESIIAAERFSISVAEAQTQQTEAILGTVSSGINADVVKAQAVQTETILGTNTAIPAPAPTPIPVILGGFAGNGNLSQPIYFLPEGKPYVTLREKKRRLLEIAEAQRKAAEQEAIRTAAKERDEQIAMLERFLPGGSSPTLAPPTAAARPASLSIITPRVTRAAQQAFSPVLAKRAEQEQAADVARIRKARQEQEAIELLLLGAAA
jgi:hypothetical protein